MTGGLITKNANSKYKFLSRPEMGKGFLRVKNPPWDEKSKIYSR
jgi:hypothetical protein